MENCEGCYYSKTRKVFLNSVHDYSSGSGMELMCKCLSSEYYGQPVSSFDTCLSFYAK